MNQKEMMLYQALGEFDTRENRIKTMENKIRILLDNHTISQMKIASLIHDFDTTGDRIPFNTNDAHRINEDLGVEVFIFN